MTPPAAPPPTKKRKVSKTNSVCNKKKPKSSFCKLGDDRKKVLEVARGGLQDVNVAFYRASEMTVLDKKDGKIEKVWSDLKQGTRGILQTCHNYIKKGKEYLAKAPDASHRDYLKHRPKHSGYPCSSLLKMKNLKDLLPSSKFHSVRKRTPFSCKIEHIRTGASLYFHNGHDSESKMGATANKSTFLSVPMSMGAAQSGTYPLVSQILERTATESDIFPVCGVEKKHSEKGTHNLDFKGSILDGGGLEVRRKITKAYVRNKKREPFFKDERPDLYALHLLADTALNLESEPIFHVQVQKQNGESRQDRNEHDPLSTDSKSHASKVNAERNGGQGSTSEAGSIIQKDLHEVSLNVHIFPELRHLICTSIDEKQIFNQELTKKDKELISKDNISINSHMAGFRVTQESQLVAVNADQKADGVENECVDCHSSLCTQPPTVECFQTRKSNVKDVTKLSIAPSQKGAFLPEHRERIDETIVEKDDIDLKGDSECFREQYSVLVSTEPVCHDKVSSAWCELEPCSTYRENSQPRLLTCMEIPPKPEGYPSSSSAKSFFNRSLEDSLNSKGWPSSLNTTKLRNQSPGYRVREIVQSSKLKATGMVDVAIKVMSSMKVGEDAYAMIAKALDSVGIRQVEVHSRISRLQHCSYLQNRGPGNCHQDLLCNPAEVAAIVHYINSTVPTFSRNDSQLPPKLISACVAALLMIQACSDTGLPPAEAMEILEHASRDLHPQYSQNLHFYREIEELMSIIKTQVLSLVRTPVSNLQM